MQEPATRNYGELPYDGARKGVQGFEQGYLVGGVASAEAAVMPVAGCCNVELQLEVESESQEPCHWHTAHPRL